MQVNKWVPKEGRLLQDSEMEQHVPDFEVPTVDIHASLAEK